jgi:hypothetical protein
MFNTSKYTSIYYSIINNAQSRNTTGYVERHHIIPRCLGGTNDPMNIVRLTAREHFICHLLLIRMVRNDVKNKMVYAAWQQSRSAKTRGARITSRTYAKLRTQLSETYTGRKRKAFSEEWRANMSKAHTGKKVPASDKMLAHLSKMTEERRSYIGKANPFYGKTHSTDYGVIVAARNVAVFAGVPKMRVSCIHCRKEVSHNMINRYHGDNCKSLRK